jgi:hypothetical protein
VRRSYAELPEQNLTLCHSLKDNEKAIELACKKDLGKSSYETYLSESGWLTNDIVFVTQNLEKWAKDESPPDIDLVNSFLKPRIRKDPIGAVLVIGYVLCSANKALRQLTLSLEHTTFHSSCLSAQSLVPSLQDAQLCSSHPRVLPTPRL